MVLGRASASVAARVFAVIVLLSLIDNQDLARRRFKIEKIVDSLKQNALSFVSRNDDAN